MLATQQMMKTALILSFVVLFTGCYQRKSVPTDQQPAIAPLVNDGDILVNIDRIRQAVNAQQSLAALRQLDSLRCQSEGYVSEAIDEAAANIWAQQFKLTVRYLAQHPESCLRRAVVYGISADMSTADSYARELASFRQSALDSGRTTGLSEAEVLFLRKLLSEINPALLD